MPLPVDATERFSDRVADYTRYRPDYPPALLAWLQRECSVDRTWRVADIGAGTGISTRMLLAAGCTVTAVEPNAAMRAAAIAALGDEPRFHAQDGRADATGLAAASVDLVTVAQAFHWFDREAARREFARILRPGGLVAIWWNSHKLHGSAFLEGYEALLQTYGTDYAEVARRHADDASMFAWFGTGLRGHAHFDHHQYLDFDGLRGRLLSSSYVPRPEQASYAPMLAALQALFTATAVDGRVDFAYDTRIFAGTPG